MTTDGRVPVIRGERVYLRSTERSDIPTFVRLIESYVYRDLITGERSDPKSLKPILNMLPR